MTFDVELSVNAYYTITVEADSIDAARNAAIKEYETNGLEADYSDIDATVEVTGVDMIKEQVNEYLRENETPFFDNKDGKYVYECYADYDEHFSDSEIHNIIEAATENGTIDITDYFDGYYENFEEEIYNTAEAIRSWLSKKGIDASEDDIREVLWDLISIEYPVDHYLNQTVKVDILLDTGDGNVDFTCNSWGLGSWDGESGKLDERSSLLWLAQQQGYTAEQFYNELVKGDLLEGKNFLESCRVEWYNLTSDLGAVTFLVEMPLRQLIKIHELMSKQTSRGDARCNPDCGTIVLGKNTECGLYSPWNGAGSVLGVMLEKDVEIPVKFIWRAEPDQALDTYSVEDTYGLCGSAWRDTLKEIREPDKAE